MRHITTALSLLSVLVAGCGDPDEPRVDEDLDGYYSDEDCDDQDPDTHPFAREYCDGVDNDCDGEVDDGEDLVDGSTWYADRDDDGYGDPRLTRAACDQPEGYLPEAGDCDDDDPAIHEGAEELCDGIDNDCDGETDEGLPDASTWYRDRDYDGYGSDAGAVVSCVQPEGYVAEGGDCNDGDASLGPHVDEVCDGVDNDCDGETDEGDATDASTFYADADEDGYGDPDAPIAACAQPAGTVTDASDCDDGDDAINPDGVEACDGADNDCDGEADEAGAVGETTFYLDADGDGFGLDGSTIMACALPSGAAEVAGDCDDDDGASYPGADEICINGVDEDCDGVADDGCTMEHCGAITASETWPGHLVHHVTCDVYVHGSSSPELTVNDGALVLFDAGTGLYAGWSGDGLVTVDGTAAGVTFASASATPAAGDWSGLFLGAYASASTLEGLTVSSAGGGSAHGAITVSGSAPTLTGCSVVDSATSGLYVTSGGAPTVTGCAFEDNVDDGVFVDGTAGLARGATPTFADNVITGNAQAITLPANVADMLDPSSTFSGNDTEGIFLLGDTIEQDSTWLDLDQPYVVTGDVRVSWSTTPVLTIAEGVEVRFEADTRLEAGVAGSGTLRAVGTAADPILFTSAATTPSAGDWQGILLGPFCTDASVVFDYVTIDYGGGAPSPGALVFDGCDGSIDNSTIRDSGSWGLLCSSGAAPTIGTVTYAGNASGDESCGE